VPAPVGERAEGLSFGDGPGNPEGGLAVDFGVPAPANRHDVGVIQPRSHIGLTHRATQTGKPPPPQRALQRRAQLQQPPPQ
jgi:hypothetical protein